MRKRQLLQTSVLMAVFALSVVEPIAAQEQTTTTPVASAASVDAVEKINNSSIKEVFVGMTLGVDLHGSKILSPFKI